MKRLKKNKKGSHVGIILSFTLFIIFIVFIYAVIAPSFKINEQKRNEIKQLKTNLINEASDEIILLRAYDLSSDCIEIENPNLDFTTTTAVVIDSNEQSINSIYSANTIQIEGGQGQYKIYYSENHFESSSYGGADCVSISPKSIVNEKRILEKKFTDLIHEVQENYTNSKSILRVASDEEFNVLFEYSNGTTIGEETRDIKGDVYAETFDINYLDFQGREKTGELIISIW